MTRNFIIENINNDDDVNNLSLKLNDLEEVQHIKVLKNAVSFSCVQPESVQEILDDFPTTYSLKEIVNSRKRNYRPTKRKFEQIFLFTNLDEQEEADEIAEILSKYKSYEDINIDFANKLLTLKTADTNVMNRLKRICASVNPAISVESWKKPFKSQDMFKEKYMKRYFKIAVAVVGIALGLVTGFEPSIITYVAWLVVLVVVSERTIHNALKDLRVKQYVSDNTIVCLCCLFAWIYGAFIEAVFVSLIYQAGNYIIVGITSITMDKMDALINPEIYVHKYSKESVDDILIDDIDIDDQIIVCEGEVIPLGGKVMAGKAKLDVFAITSNEELEETKRYTEVTSGSIVVEGEIRVKITSSYEKSAINQVTEIASQTTQVNSKISKLMNYVSGIYSYAMVVLALVVGIVLPIINLNNNWHYLYIAAIILAVAGSFEYKQGTYFGILSGVAKAFSKGIVIRENKGLDDLNSCKTIIYDRYDGVETTPEEMELFASLKKTGRKLIIFNDGPTDLENTEYEIYNNLPNSQKEIIMNRQQGRVVYIGDNSKDIALLQKAYVGICRGGVHNKRVLKNSDIMITNSDLETINDMFKISKMQRNVSFVNAIVGIVVSLIVVALAFASTAVVNLAVAAGVYLLLMVFILFNTQRIISMK